MSQVAHSITHSLSTSPPDPPSIRTPSHILHQHQQNKLNPRRDLPSNALNLHDHVHQLQPGHAKSFSLDQTSSSPPPSKRSPRPKPTSRADPPSTYSIDSSHPPLPSSTIPTTSSSFTPFVSSIDHDAISSFHFPVLNLSSPTPPPIDKNDYFDQFPSSHPPKSARPLHQKTQSETAMRLQLPRSLPSSSHLPSIPMLRKKSGEVVRSSLKLVSSSPRGCATPTYASSRSAPSTPLSGPKAVHFDSHLEHVRHFLSQQRPMAVSRDGSPIETETEGEEEYPFPDMGSAAGSTSWNTPPPRTKLVIELLNMPLVERPPMVVCLKSIELSPDGKNLQGTVQVENLSFEKRVAVRFTFDKWQTVSEVTADYLSSGRPLSKLDDRQSFDLFGFTIKLQDVLARIEDREMEIAVRYQAAGGEFWDNNFNSNYHVRFKHLRINNHPSNPQQPPTRQVLPSQLGILASQKLPSSLTQSSANESCPWAVTLRAELDRLVGDDLGLPMASGGGIKKKLSNPISGSPGLDGLPAMTRSKCGTGLSARYDFSSSLKQATCNSKQPSRSNRFELSLPSPVSPVPIEWLGVMPINSDGSPRRNSVDSFSSTLETCYKESPSKDAAIYRGSNKRWTIPGMVHVPNLPPSPPQDSPNMGQMNQVDQLPSPPPQQNENQQDEGNVRNQGGGGTGNNGLTNSIGTPRISNQDDSNTKQQYGINSKPQSPSQHRQHKQPTSFINFHRSCPSGLVTPQSPSLTDDSA